MYRPSRQYLWHQEYDRVNMSHRQYLSNPQITAMLQDQEAEGISQHGYDEAMGILCLRPESAAQPFVPIQTIAYDGPTRRMRIGYTADASYKRRSVWITFLPRVQLWDGPNGHGTRSIVATEFLDYESRIVELENQPRSGFPRNAYPLWRKMFGNAPKKNNASQNMKRKAQEQIGEAKKKVKPIYSNLLAPKDNDDTLAMEIPELISRFYDFATRMSKNAHARIGAILQKQYGLTKPPSTGLQVQLRETARSYGYAKDPRDIWFEPAWIDFVNTNRAVIRQEPAPVLHHPIYSYDVWRAGHLQLTQKVNHLLEWYDQFEV